MTPGRNRLDQMDGEACEYLIKKGPYFYREDKSGYTEFKFDAGRYTKEDAEREAEIEPWHMKAIHQDDVPDKTDPDKFIRELEARATAAEATVTALQEALEPFASAADAFDPPENDDSFLTYGTTFTFGDLRRARTALATIRRTPHE